MNIEKSAKRTGPYAILVWVILLLVHPNGLGLAAQSDGFVFPVLGNSQSDPTRNTKDPLTDGWGGNGLGWSDPSGSPKGHLGQDYYLSSGCSGSSDNTAGQPVYAVSNGKVVQVIDNPDTWNGWDDAKDHGWGRVIVIEHIFAPGFSADGTTMLTTTPNQVNPRNVYSLYGHLKKGSILVTNGQEVSKGQKIGEIGKGGTDVSWPCSHLHFEIKNSSAYTSKEYAPQNNITAYCCGTQPTYGIGFGYSGTNNYAPNRYIPSSFILKNKVVNRALVQQEGDTKIYWLQNGKLYHVINQNIIDAMANIPGWGISNLVSLSSLAPYTDNDKAFISTNGQSNGLLIKLINTPHIYLINNDKRERIPSPEEFNNRGCDWADVIEVSQPILDIFTSQSEPSGIEVGQDAPSEAIRQIFISNYDTNSSNLGASTDVVKPAVSLLTGSNGYYQTFDNGSIQCMSDGPYGGQAFVIYGNFYAKWGQMGYANNPLGFPTSNKLTSTSSFGSAGDYQTFEGGSIQFNGNVPFAVYGDIHKKWSQMGYADSPLGFPVGDRLEAASGFGTPGYYQRFQGGSIQVCGNNTFGVYGEIYEEWGKHGYAGRDGYPVADSIENGHVTWAGFPTSDRYPCSGRQCQDFEGGYIESDGSTAEFISTTHPSNLTAEVQSDGSVFLTWKNRIEATGINLFRAASPAERITVLSPSETSYTDTTAQKGAQYVYHLTAYNKTAESPMSNQTAVNAGQLDEGPWPIFHHDLQHTGRSTSFVSNPPEIKWQFKTGDYSPTSPAISSDGTIYVGSCEGYLFALNPDGTSKWQFKTGDYTPTSPAISSDGIIYVGSSEGYLFALNPDGTSKWKLKIGDSRPTEVTIGSDGTIYLGGNNCLNAVNSDGTMKWYYYTGGYGQSSPSIDSLGTIYIAASVSVSVNTPLYLYAISAGGTLKWRNQLLITNASSPAIGADNTIYVISYNGSGYDYAIVHAFNPNGDVKWQKQLGGGGFRPDPVLGLNDTIYLSYLKPKSGGVDFAFSAIDVNGTLKWEKIFAAYHCHGAVDHNGIVYISSVDGNLYAYAEDGTQQWNIQLGLNSYSDPVIGSNGFLYVGAGDGLFYALGLPQGKGQLCGTITDLGTAKPIVDATITTSGGTVQSSSAGTYAMTLDSGIYDTTVSKTNYQTMVIPGLTVTAGRCTEVDIELPNLNPFNIITADLPPAYITFDYSARVLANGGRWPYSYAIAYGQLPPGLLVDAANGKITGTPTALGSYTFGVSVTDAYGTYAEKEFFIDVSDELVFVTESPLPRGTVNERFAVTIGARGGSSPYAFSIVSGTAPPGISLATDGSFSGTPSSTGSYQFTVKIADALGRNTRKEFYLKIVDTLVITTAQLNDGIIGYTYDQTLTASGGYGGYRWVVYSGVLPTGLSLDSVTGVLAGVPTQATTRNITISVSDEDGRIGYRLLTLRVTSSLQILSTTLPDGLINEYYSEVIRVIGGIEPFNFSYTGQLPAGLTLDSHTGIVFGTPTTPEYTNFGITVTDSTYPNNQSASRVANLRITRLLTITTSSTLSEAKRNVAIDPIVLTAGGGSSPYYWEFVDGRMPQGLVLNKQLGEFSGIAKESGDFTFTIRVEDTANSTAEKEFYWHIGDPIYVPEDFTTIESAVWSAANGDAILVGPGIYHENLSLVNRNLRLISSDGPDSTVIDGNRSGRVLNVEGTQLVIDGFTISGGMGEESGGGIKISSNSSVIVKNCRVYDNYVESFKNCWRNYFYDDSYGGGIYNSGSLEIINSLIINNLTDSGCCSPTLNTWWCGVGYGGAIYSTGSLKVVNSVIAHNEAFHGAALFIQNADTVVNSIVWGNLLSTIFYGSHHSVGDTKINTNAAQVTYSDIEGGYQGIGNIAVDPLFIGAENGDYRLDAASQCIDAGTSDVDGVLDTDIEGYSRVTDGDGDGIAVVDMGAYERFVYQPLNSIAISGPSEVNENSGVQYTCTATYSDGRTGDATNIASWSVNSPYASISGGMLTTREVTGNQPVSVNATYSLRGVSRTGTKIVTIVDTTDIDRDGMPDWWEKEYGLNLLINDANSDLDGDGWSNFEEYRRGTDPSEPKSHPSRAMPWIPLLLGD